MPGCCGLGDTVASPACFRTSLDPRKRGIGGIRGVFMASGLFTVKTVSGSGKKSSLLYWFFFVDGSRQMEPANDDEPETRRRGVDF